MRKLGFVDSNGIVTMKGRAAAEIQSADELVLTELMFNGVFKVSLLFASAMYLATHPLRRILLMGKCSSERLCSDLYS